MSVDEKRVYELEKTCYKVRKDLLNFIYRIGMGHLGGELSLVEIAVALYHEYMRWTPEMTTSVPKDQNRDRLVLSKAHCSETLYTIYQDMGIYTMDFMVEHFESLETSMFGMHCNRKYCPQIEASCGSLGHGLPLSVGMALGARYRKEDWRTFCIIGDGEFNEGTNWEALMSGAHYGLQNLVVILDKNKLQMTGTTAHCMNIDPVDEKVRAFGWNVIEIEDGNDMAQVCAAFEKLPERSLEKGKPTFIIANTIKGKDVDFMENQHKWHGGGIGEEDLKRALASVDANWEKRHGEVK